MLSCNDATDTAERTCIQSNIIEQMNSSCDSNDVAGQVNDAKENHNSY